MMMTYFGYIFFLLAIILSVIYRFPQFRMFRNVFRKNKAKSGGTSAYQTLLVTLAANLGTGNLVGVTTGVILGGPGVLFWMIIYAFFSCVFSYMENTLSQIYKEKMDGEFRGGACYYILKGMKSPLLGFIFAIYLLFTNTILFPPLQTNTISETGLEVYHIHPLVTGFILILLIWILVFRGTKIIVKTSEKIVPLMSVTFVAIVLVVLAFNFDRLPAVFSLIVSEGLTLKAFSWGLMSETMVIGIKRSMFSNEAGLGTMPSISAMADTDKPTDQGYFQMFGVFIDTIFLCTIMGIYILIYSPNLADFSGSDLIVNVFSQTFGALGPYLASFFLYTFAFASLCGGYYLGESNALYFSSHYRFNRRLIITVYRMLFLSGIIIGVTRTTLENFALVDAGMLALGSLNVFVIIWLSKINKRDLKN
jgi:AGCS family alanine or glycine:cation symporter